MGSKWLKASLLAALSLCVAAGARAEDNDPLHPAGPPHGLRFTGRVEAASQAALSARVAGTVDKVHVDEGDRVKKGQVLIELSAPELKDDLDAAAARLDQAKAEVEQAEAGAHVAKVRLAGSDAELQAAKDAYKRVRENAGANGLNEAEIVASRDRFDKAGTARELAAAELAHAEAGVKIARAGVEIAQAGLRRAQTRLDFTRIVAPFDGVVSRRTVEVGTTVGPATQGEAAPLLTVMRDDVVHVLFDVDERSAPQVVVGRPVLVCVPSLRDAAFPGKVTRTARAFNPDTGTLRAEVDLPNPDGKLRPGLFVTVDVTADKPGK